MEIKINIDESKFQEVLEKELAAFSQEEIHAIMKAAFEEYLNRDEVIKGLLQTDEVDRWGSTIKNSSLLNKIVQKEDFSDIFKEPKKKIAELINKDDVIKGVAMELLAGIFRDRFRGAFVNDYNFIEEISNRVANTLYERKQNNGGMYM